MKRLSSLVLALALTLAACSDGGDGVPKIVDGDGDGISNANDCAPQDASRWRIDLYSSRDQDRDNVAVNASGQICSGASLPPGYSYSTVTTAPDCDDNNATIWISRAYAARDMDLDGVGVAGAGTLCAGAALPAGYLTTAPAENDCDDANATRWANSPYAARDEDGDGFRVNMTGLHCGNGTLPPNLFAQGAPQSLVDCDDVNLARWRNLGLYRDLDGDGVGAGVVSRQCVGEIPAGFAVRGYDPLDDPTNAASAALREMDIDVTLLMAFEDEDDTP